MKLTESLIHQSFASIGLLSSDVVFIHADAGPAAQLVDIPKDGRVDEFIEIILSYFDKGTVIVPTFSYSLTNGEVFNREQTPSSVGSFSEKFRKYNGVKRSSHPVFSVGAYGVEKDYYTQTVLSDCFGEGTVFDKLFKHDAKIICIGCSLNRATFVHFVEQNLGVDYRYPKMFKGELICNDVKHSVETRYFVRNLDIDTSCDLSSLKAECAMDGSLQQANLGRFPILSISAQEFFNSAIKLVQTAPYALIGEGS